MGTYVEKAALLWERRSRGEAERFA